MKASKFTKDSARLALLAELTLLWLGLPPGNPKFIGAIEEGGLKVEGPKFVGGGTTLAVILEFVVVTLVKLEFLVKGTSYWLVKDSVFFVLMEFNDPIDPTGPPISLSDSIARPLLAKDTL